MTLVKPKLQEALRKASEHKFYEDRAGKDISSMERFKDLPFLSKEDLYYLKNPSHYVLFSSSGSSSNPRLFRLSHEDFDRAVERVIESYEMAGVTSQDVVMNNFSYGFYIAGHMYDAAARRIGCSLLPVGSGKMTPTTKKIEVMGKIPVSVINGNPSYIGKMLRNVKDRGSLDEVLDGVRVVQLAGERLSDKERTEIEKELGCEVFNQYGTTELASIGAECRFHRGLHIFDDYYAEIIDPETGTTVNEGGMGELVVTELNTSEIPAIRYRTRDQMVYIGDKCECGRNLPLVKPVRRLDDEVKIKGRLVSKSALVRYIEEEIGISDFRVRIGPGEQFDIYLAEETELESLRRKVGKEFEVTPDEVIFEEGLEVDMTHSMKAKKFVDER